MMHNPPHPEEVIRELCIVPLGITINQAAEALGVSRKALSELLNGHSGISTEMVLMLAIAFNTIPESWLSQQTQYDLWQTRNKQKTLKVERLALAA